MTFIEHEEGTELTIYPYLEAYAAPTVFRHIGWIFKRMRVHGHADLIGHVATFLLITADVAKARIIHAILYLHPQFDDGLGLAFGGFYGENAVNVFDVHVSADDALALYRRQRRGHFTSIGDPDDDIVVYIDWIGLMPVVTYIVIRYARPRRQPFRIMEDHRAFNVATPIAVHASRPWLPHAEDVD